MPTPTIARPSSGPGRMRRQQPAPQGRFSRHQQPAQQSRFSRHRQPEPSRMNKMMSSVTEAMPGMGSSSRKRRAKRKSAAGRSSTGKRAGGMALLAGGVGLAMKNRDKLMGMMGRGEHHEQQHTSTPPTSTPPMSTSTGTTP